MRDRHMNQIAVLNDPYVRAAALKDIQASGCHVVYLKGYAIALFQHNGHIHAIDNRCPHMGFPLDKGTVKDGILTCHWHHARFDLASGGTFDLWADDVRAFPVEIRGDHVWVNLAPQPEAHTHHLQRLQEGLEQRISLVIAKSVIALLDSGTSVAEPFRVGLNFGTHYREGGWSSGLTIHTCMHNLLPQLEGVDRPQALFHGLAAVARDCAGKPPRFGVEPLPTMSADFPTLKRWFRQFVDVRDTQGAERCLVSAIRTGASPTQIADLLFAAATDHRYIDGGHTLDFTNKALEALDITGWDQAEAVLSSLVKGYAKATRKEESNAWRSPVDLIAILESAFAELPTVLSQGESQSMKEVDRDAIVTVLLGENASAIAQSLLESLHQGCPPADLAGIVAYAAALRIARFHTNNDFRDWDTAHHSYTFANAVHQGLRRVSSPELVRGVFDAAMTIYLNRFLNIPAAPLPQPKERVDNPDVLLQQLPDLLDRQQQVNPAGELVAQYLYSGGEGEHLLALLGKLLLREDRSFHTIQEIEVAFRQYSLLRDTPAGVHVLVAAARYLAAHAPTMRSQGQTYQIAHRLHRGDHLFEAP